MNLIQTYQIDFIVFFYNCLSMFNPFNFYENFYGRLIYETNKNVRICWQLFPFKWFVKQLINITTILNN